MEDGTFMPFMVGKESRCFEDCERTLEELKSLFFNALYFWTIVYVSPLIINYHVFLVFCSYYLCGFSNTLCVHGGALRFPMF
jgi:hypothetical protein